MRSLILKALRGQKGPGYTLLRGLLRVLSLPFGMSVRIRNAAYSGGWLRARHPGAPVISVGNLTAGGTGKTPAVEYLFWLLKGMGRRPAVLTRGYGAKTAEGMSDETAAMDADVPVVVSADRLQGAQRALKEGADCLLLDDGFQHRRLARDMDILLLDALDPWGGGRLLPAGFLREPVSAARRADVIILARSDLVDRGRREAVEGRLHRAGARAEVLHARHAPVGLAGDLSGPPETLKGMPAHLFSGVGNPEGFKGTALSLGVEVLGETRFPDHHPYAPADIKDLAGQAAKEGAKILLTTTKDWVKVRNYPRGALPLSVLRIRFEIASGEDRLKAMLAKALGAPGPVETPK
ncbi:MAG: tetraacyldisaccharide 4'-kinase [Planctomycetota bacterium]|jgi:tetraacyldisaccharide 4'-kinase